MYGEDLPGGAPHPDPAGEDGRNYSGDRAKFNGAHTGLNGSRRGSPRIFAPETFTTSRLLDFSSRRELAAQVGHEPNMWPAVIAKELCDNGIDAAEQAGLAPRLRVTATEGMIEVVDNGPGIDGAVIDDILDFNVRVSSREAYVGPWRGAQGNALKTILVMPRCPVFMAALSDCALDVWTGEGRPGPGWEGWSVVHLPIEVAISLPVGGEA